MCTTVWSARAEISTQRELAILVGTSVKRLPLAGYGYTERSLIGRSCLCPIDVGKALAAAGLFYERDDTGDYVVLKAEG